MTLQIPPGDERFRAMCQACHYIEYSNPKIVVASVVWNADEKVLLGQRAIEPRLGYWGIPQGYLEHGETSREAAARETLEETGVVVVPSQLTLRAVYNVPGSVQLVYEARVADAQQTSTATHESTQVGWFATDNLPELCFPTVQWAIDHCQSGSDRVEQRTKFYDGEQWRDVRDE